MDPVGTSIVILMKCRDILLLARISEGIISLLAHMTAYDQSLSHVTAT